MTDPDAVDVPIKTLLSESYLAERRDLIDPGSSLPADVKAGLSPEDHSVNSQDPGGDTCYLSIVDDDGLVVSLIQSIYFDFGSGMIAGETGSVPQNGGSFLSLNPDHINSLVPGKRTFHTLIPALLSQDGAPRLVYGTMGGVGQPQT